MSPALGSRRPQAANKGHGSTTVLTPDRRRMPAESIGEGKLMLAVLALPWVRRVVEQPEPVQYVDDDGVERSFTFDLLVEATDGRRYLVEVKPSDLAARRDTGKLLATIAPQVGLDRADGVVLLTERHVPRAVMHDAEITWSARMHPAPADDERLLAALRSGGARLADLGATTGLHGRAVRAAARLLGDGVLVKVAPGRIGPDLVVVRAGGTP